MTFHVKGCQLLNLLQYWILAVKRRNNQTNNQRRLPGLLSLSLLTSYHELQGISRKSPDLLSQLQKTSEVHAGEKRGTSRDIVKFWAKKLKI